MGLVAGGSVSVLGFDTVAFGVLVADCLVVAVAALAACALAAGGGSPFLR